MLQQEYNSIFANHVKLTFELINKEIGSLFDGNTIKGSIALLNENRELTDKYNSLKQKYDSISTNNINENRELTDKYNLLKQKYDSIQEIINAPIKMSKIKLI